MLEEIDKPDGSKHFMKRCAAPPTPRPCPWRGSSQPAGEPPSQRPSQPRSPPRRTVSNGLPTCLTRYIVALCREDDPAPCPRVATPAQPLEHPDIGRYFSGFDPQRGYLPTAELAARYPDG